jgi:hypothetical protein
MSDHAITTHHHDRTTPAKLCLAPAHRPLGHVMHKPALLLTQPSLVGQV